MIKKIGKQFRSNIIAGALLLIPSVGTIYIFVQLFGVIDSILPKFIHSIVHEIPETWIPGLGLVLILLITYFVGLAAKNYFGRVIIDTGNSIIANIPIANKIYNAIQQIIDSINMNKTGLFEKVVLVQFPSEGTYSIGFLTADNAPEASAAVDKDLVSVYVPTTPSPISGFLIFVPRTDIHELNISTETAMKAIISCGLISTEQIQQTNNNYTLPNQLKKFKWTSIFSKKNRNYKPTDPRD